MKKVLLYIIALCLALPSMAIEHGTPFFRNFSAKEYNAHNQNFDIVCDDNGTLFVANFEGLLYFDGCLWRKIHTPGISRVTRLTKAPDGRIWVGGYNVLGYLTASGNGVLQLQTIISDANNRSFSEVDGMKAEGKNILVHTSNGTTYAIKDGKHVVPTRKMDISEFSNNTRNITNIALPDRSSVTYTEHSGLVIKHSDGQISTLTLDKGLTSNIISNIYFDGRHGLWGTTNEGLFCAEVCTPYSHITTNDGIDGEVNDINELNNVIYIGTNEGIYALRHGEVERIVNMSLSCMAIISNGKNQLIAVTSDGLYAINGSGVTRMNSIYTLSACIDPLTGDVITGELDGVYRNPSSGSRTRIAPIEKVNELSIKGKYIHARNIYGALWQLPLTNAPHLQMKCLQKNYDSKTPRLSVTDRFSRQWVTNSDGKGISLKSTGKGDSRIANWIYPLKKEVLNTFFVSSDGDIFAGGDFGVIVIDNQISASLKIEKVVPPIIRRVVAMNDSVIWGGYSEGTLKPLTNIEDIDLPSSCTYVRVDFSSTGSSLVFPALFRYRIDGGKWSAWSKDMTVEFHDASYGDVTLEVQTLDLIGRESPISTVSWYIHYPFYLRWWAVLFYIIVGIAAVMAFLRWRTKRLERDKAKLEAVVKERTAALSDTLDDLKRTQKDLVRMERTATAGKLTQGLIDRILNPINYINNFSKLTSGLAKDLREDIEDEKDSMSEDNYEDCEDILDMMTQNLGKIEEHGVNTTRTLRAMEAMLNNHIGALINQDIVPLCRQAVSVAAEYHKDVIAKFGISLSVDAADNTPVMADIDADAMNRVLLSLISNSIHAVAKKCSAEHQDNPSVTLSVKTEDNGAAVITLHDTGIGIEDTIKDKVFDPFFTTKPTGEAAGVGLYLVREIIHDHNGTVTFDSRQGEFTTFTITL